MAEHSADKAFAKSLTNRITEELNRTLEPALRAEERIDKLVAQRAPRVRLYELFPLFLSLAAAFLLGLRYYHFNHYVLFQRYIRGLLLTVYAALLLILFAPGIGSIYPLIVPADGPGILAPLLHRAAPSRLIVFSFPVVVIMLTTYALLFDFRNRYGVFLSLLLPAPAGLLSPVILRGYPLRFAVACIALVVLIRIYMRRLPITAHDGRPI